MAGESAKDAARRQREKAERLQRSAELWEQGAAGEEATAEALAALPASEWAVFHDLRWPGRRYANVDHVVVGPPGVFVIDSKHWSGSVTVKDGVLRQNGRSREKSVAAASEAAIAVAQLTRVVTIEEVHPVLCFVGDRQLTGWARDVMVCTTSNLVEMLVSRRPALTAEQRRLLALDLDASMRAAGSPTLAPEPGRRRNRVDAASAPTPKTPRRRSSRKRGGAIRALIGLGIAAFFLFGGGARDAVIQGVVDRIVPQTVSTTPEETDSPKDPTPRGTTGRTRTGDK